MDGSILTRAILEQAVYDRNLPELYATFDDPAGSVHVIVEIQKLSRDAPDALGSIRAC